MQGCHGRYWRFDLSRGAGSLHEIPEDVQRAYLGGVGIGSWLLHREAPPRVDPLSPEAPLIFAFSPLVGTPLTTSAKFAVVAKSPLTGMLCDALSSSHFAIAGKRMGVDAIVLVGCCETPSVLVAAGAEDGASVESEVRPTSSWAHDLWGLSAEKASAALATLGRVAAIGPAGEALVRFATISNEGRHAGRGGLGAVMGAKRLKAFVVRGHCETRVADAGAVRELARGLARRSQGPATAKYRELGTAANLTAFARVGALPQRNFAGQSDAAAPALTTDQLAKGRQHTRASCAACTIGCEHRYASGDGSVRAEYESLFALGPLCGIDDAESVLAAARRCDELGLDTVSAGGTIAFAMECAERGLLPAAPRFGDSAGLMQLLDDIAARRGLGGLLAEGSRRAALEIGEGSLDFAAQVKGLELPGYEPRAVQTLALGFAVGTRGADHNKSAAYELDFSHEVDRLHGSPAAAQRALEPEDRAALLDSLILCKFLRGAFDDLYADAAELLRAVTGLDFDGDELRATAKRVVDLKKSFNIREGWKPEDDTLPARLLDEAIPDGPVAGTRLTRERLGAMIESYNLARGWTREGYLAPSQEEALYLDV